MPKVKYESLPGGGYAYVTPIDWSPCTNWAADLGLYADGSAIWDETEQVADLAIFLGAGGMPFGEQEVDAAELVWLSCNEREPRVIRQKVEVEIE